MKTLKIVSGIFLIVLAFLLSVPAMLSTITLFEALMKIGDAYGIGFFIGNALGYLLLWVIVFFLVFYGVKLIKSSKRTVLKKLDEL